MPYVTEEKRVLLDGKIEALGDALNEHDIGTVNYAVTRLMMLQHPASYSQFNELIGVLECVKLELYRRAVAPYENQKRQENGDVPEYDTQAENLTV